MCDICKHEWYFEMPMWKLIMISITGTMAAACKLIKQLECDIVECVVVIELTDLKGRDKLTDKIFSLTTYSGE